MNWMEGLNQAIDYIEEHLLEELDLDRLSRYVNGSPYEFSRLFSVMAGMPVSEYIRRRRLSQAVFDIQRGEQSLTETALKYGYESHSTFARAFKELHGYSPKMARQAGIKLKVFTKITFKLIVKGVSELEFRIVERGGFPLIGNRCQGTYADWQHNDRNLRPQLHAEGYFSEPLWYVGAYSTNTLDPASSCLIGAEWKEKPVIENMEIEQVQASMWVVFPFEFEPGRDCAGEIYGRAVSEWLPLSEFKRNEQIPVLEVYGATDLGADHVYEVWVPICRK